MRRATGSAFFLLGLLLAAVPAWAQSPPASLQTYFGQDKPTSAPYTAVPPGGNAATARAAFDGGIRLETVGLESFETPAAQNDANKRSSLTVAFQGSGTSQTTRTTVDGTFTGLEDVNGVPLKQYTIRNDGKNGTFATHGSQYLGSDKGYIEVNFAVPVSAFGFYGTDFGEGSTKGLKLKMYEVDGSVYTVEYQSVDGRNGGVLFYGFTDQERQYERVDIQSVDANGTDSNEYFGFDSFIIADVNQVAGAEFADTDGNGPGSAAASAVEGETIRLLLRLDATQFPNGGEVDVALTGGTGTAADLDGYQTVRAVVDAGEVPAGEPGAGSDYDLTAVPVEVTLDGVPDDGETFVFTLQNGSGGFAGRDGETLVLTVGDPLPAFSQSFGPAPAVEDQPTTYTFTVGNAGNGRGASGLAFSTRLPNDLGVAAPSNAVSTCGGSVSTTGGRIALSGGAVSADATCGVSVDVVPSRAGGLTLAPVFLDTDRGASQAEGTVLAVTRSVSLTASSASAAEGGVVRLTATLSSAAQGGESVDVALVASGTTGGAADLSAGGATPYATQTLAFTQGQTTASVDVAVNDDGLTEGEESFRFALQNATGAAPVGPSALDLTVAASGPRAAFVATSGADPAQTAGATAVSVDAVEGDEVKLTVRLSDKAAGGESVDVALVTGAPTTGTAADLGDYTTQTVAFTTGQTERTVTVPVTVDGVAENAETVRLALQNAQGGLTLGGAEAFDLAIAESFAGASFATATASAVEGDDVTVTLRLAAPAQGGETVDVVLVSGAPTTGSAADLGGYTTQTVTFAAGKTDATLVVPVTADRRAEEAETFRFTLDGAVDPAGQQTLDLTVAASNATAAFARASAAAAEGDDVTVTVALTGPALGGEAVDVVLASGDPADLGGFTSRRVTFAAGDASASFAVSVTEDGVADRDETFTFALDNPAALDLDAAPPSTFDLAVDQTGAFLSFDILQGVAGEGAGSYAIALSLSQALTSPATVTVTLASGDPADLGGFTGRTVAMEAGATALVVEVPVTDDEAREDDETFAFELSDARGNEPDGISLDRSLFGLVVVDNDGSGSTGGGGAGGGPGGGGAVVTAPPRDADGDGAEDGGPQYLAVPLAGLTAGDVAAAAAGDGPAPTVYVLDVATGALVAADPGLALDAGQPVYVDVAPGADLTFSGSAPDGPLVFTPAAPGGAAAAGADVGRVHVAVGNPGGAPVRLSDLEVTGGTLADVVLVLNPATGAFEPVSLGSLGDGEDLVVGYGSVIVQVIPDGDAGDVSVTLDLDDADDALDAGASGLVAGRCAPSDADEALVCLTLGTAGEAPGGRDRAVVRLRPAAAGLRGQALPLDGFDGLDVGAPSGPRLALPGGADGRAALAVLSTPFTADSVITVPLAVTVAGPGTYTLALDRVVGAFAGQALEVALTDRKTGRVFDLDDPFAFDVAANEDPTSRFSLLIGCRRAVSVGGRPGEDHVGVPFPNPSAGRAALDVSVAEPQRVRATVYDALGRTVTVAFDGEVRPGAPVRVTLGATVLAPGVYVVRVDGATLRETRRLTVTR